nr:MAG TPA: hypothetical protein [Crassvirales sp.]
MVQIHHVLQLTNNNQSIKLSNKCPRNIHFTERIATLA